MDRTISALPTGTALARYLMLCSLKDPLLAMTRAEAEFRSTPQVAATFKAIMDPGGIATSWGGGLAMYGIGAEVLTFLRPATIIDRLAPSMHHVPFMTKFARETAVAGAGWVGEGISVPARRASFDTVTVPPTKTMTLVVMSQDLVRFSNPSAEREMRTQFIKAIAQFLDTQLLDPTVAPVANVNPGALTYGAVAQVSSGSTAAQIVADLMTMLGTMTTDNAPFTAPFWIMRPSTAAALAGKYTVAGGYAFPDIRVAPAGGTLLGIPVITSASSPAQITLLDASEVLLADDGVCDIQSSTEASLQIDSAPGTGPQVQTSLWQNNLFGIRAGREINWQMAQHVGSPATPAAITYMPVAY